jgi:hypothetical protein
LTENTGVILRSLGRESQGRAGIGECDWGEGLYIVLWVRVSSEGSMGMGALKWVKQEAGRIMPKEMMD